MGGHAEYGLRVFERTSYGLAAQRLENTPRADLDANEKSALMTWIARTFRRSRTAPRWCPSEFLAESADVGRAEGLARAANRPFALLLRQRRRGARQGARAPSRHDDVQRLSSEPLGRGLPRARKRSHGDVRRERARRRHVRTHARDRRVPETRPRSGRAQRRTHAGNREGPVRRARIESRRSEQRLRRSAARSRLDVRARPRLLQRERRRRRPLRGRWRATSARRAKRRRSASRPNASNDDVSGMTVKACSGATGAPRCNQSSGGFPNGLCSGPCAHARQGRRQRHLRGRGAERIQRVRRRRTTVRDVHQRRLEAATSRVQRDAAVRTGLRLRGGARTRPPGERRVHADVLHVPGARRRHLVGD